MMFRVLAGCVGSVFCSGSQRRSYQARRRRQQRRGASSSSPPAVIYLVIYLHVFFCYHRAMSSVVALGASIICNRIDGLAPRQRTVCQGHPDAMVAAGEGAKLAFSECRYQFRNHRWNCSAFWYSSEHHTTDQYSAALGHISAVGNRETAYTYAVRSAGVAYAVTQACSLGNLVGCGCDKSKLSRSSNSVALNEVRGSRGKSSSRGTLATMSMSSSRTTSDALAVRNGGFKWGGCSADVSYGLRFSRVLLDAREIDEDSRSLMNLHNNRAGRKTLLDSVRTECKCHGVSGSCTMRTCWVTLPKFRSIGDRLTQRYARARHVEAVNGNRARRPVFLRLKRGRSTSLSTTMMTSNNRRTHHRTASKSDRKPGWRDLVYLQPSLNYCDHAPWAGSLGTLGRVCNKTSTGEMGGSNSCESLCCGRGHDTRQYTRTWQCGCKFHWCCEVECRTCSERTEEYTCK